MTHRIKIAVFFSVFVLVFATCTYRANEPDICFSDDVQPLFVSKCGGCHGSFTTHEGLMKYIVKHHPLRSKIYRYIDGAHPKMPPEGRDKVTKEQLFIIKTWISRGAPNSSNCGTCDTSLYKYSADIKPIIDTWCVSCHTSGNAGGGYNFDFYSGVAVSAGNGSLLGSIKHQSGFSPMPKGSTQLSSCYITKIQNWVNAGYPNN